ncbi:MAG: thioredoxin family protein [Desulfobacterales bacterium]
MKIRFLATLVLFWIVAALVPPAAAGGSKSLEWHSFDEGMALGKSQGKIVFVFFWADWCTYCHTMDRETFHNQTVVDLLGKNFISVKVDSDREQKLSNLFRVRGLPDNWFFSKNGSVLGHRPGYIPADTFIKILRSIGNGGPES